MTNASFAKLPEPRYYSVFFSSQFTPGENGYGQMADRMVELAPGQRGYLSVESVRGTDGLGIAVSYGARLAAIAAW